MIYVTEPLINKANNISFISNASTTDFSFNVEDNKELFPAINNIKQNEALIKKDKIRTKPLSGSIISLVSSCMGSGWLALPKAFALYGVLFGSFMEIAASFNMLISLWLLSKFMVKYPDCEVYTDVVERVLGRRAKMILNGIFFMNLFGTQIAYILTSNMFFTNLVQVPLAHAIGVDPEASLYSSLLNLSGLLLMALLTLPLQLLTSTEKFGNIGKFSVATLIFVAVVISMQWPTYANQNEPEIKLVNTDEPLVMLQNLGLWIYSMYCLDTIFLIKKDMGKVTQKRIMQLGAVATTSMFVPYVLIGIFGYLSFGSAAKHQDLFPNRPAILDQSDILMNIIKSCQIATIMMAYCTRVIAMKTQFFSILGKEISLKSNIIYTLVLLFIPSIIGFVYPAVNDWVSLLGAFCMTSIAVLFPALMTLKTWQRKKESKFKIVLLTMWASFFVILGFSSAFSVILKMLHITN